MKHFTCRFFVVVFCSVPVNRPFQKQDVPCVIIFAQTNFFTHTSSSLHMHKADIFFFCRFISGYKTQFITKV